MSNTLVSKNDILYQNTGGNGPAVAVWVANWDDRTVEILQMPYRYLVNLWQNEELSEDGIPFDNLIDALQCGDEYLESGNAD